MAGDGLRLHRVSARDRSGQAPRRWRSRRFHEKPELPKAKRYVAAGNFYWNSGMFFWRADVLLDQLRQHLPKTATLLASLPAFGSPQIRRPPEGGISALRQHLDRFRGDGTGSQAKQVHGIAAAEFGWNDVGSWNAVYELLPRDPAGNVIGARIRLPGRVQQFRGCPRQTGGSARRQRPDHRRYARRPAGGHARPRATGGRSGQGSGKTTTPRLVVVWKRGLTGESACPTQDTGFSRLLDSRRKTIVCSTALH